MIINNLRTRKLELTRRDVVDLLVMLDTIEEGEKWSALHDKIKAQFDAQEQIQAARNERK